MQNDNARRNNLKKRLKLDNDPLSKLILGLHKPRLAVKKMVTLVTNCEAVQHLS